MMMQVLAAAGAAALSVVVVFLSMSWWALLSAFARLRTFPGPVPIWPLGNAHLFKFGPSGMRFQDTYNALAEKYGKVFRFFNLTRATIVICDPDAVKQVLLRSFKSFHDRGTFPVFSSSARRTSERSSILFVKGPLWKSIRGAAQPVFHSKSLQGYSQIVNEAGDEAIKSISAIPAGEAFDIDELFQTKGLELVFRCALGVAMPPKGSEANKTLLKATHAMMSEQGLTDPWRFFIFLLPPFLMAPLEALLSGIGAARQERARDIMYAVSQQLADNYSRAHPDAEPFPTDRRVLGRGLGMKLLPDECVPSEDSVLVACMKGRNRETGEPLKPSEVLAQSMIFMMAGFETTATALSLAISQVANRPGVEKKLLEEIEANGWDARPEYRALDKWPYATAIVYESLRMTPIGAILAREAVEDCTIDGRRVRAGTAVHVNIWGIHHDPQWWPEPEAFRPERFVENPNLVRSPAYLAFGHGPRNCIGMQFALLESVTLLVRLYQSYSFKLCEAHHPNGQLHLVQHHLLKPEGGAWVRAQERYTAAKA